MSRAGIRFVQKTEQGLLGHARTFDPVSAVFAMHAPDPNPRKGVERRDGTTQVNVVLTRSSAVPHRLAGGQGRSA